MPKYFRLASFALLLLSHSGLAIALKPLRPLRLWQGIAPNETVNIGPETRVQDGAQRGCGPTRAGTCDQILNVSTPTLTPYVISGVAPGAAVIVAPGGGYQHLAISKEGEDVCTLYNTLNVSCFLLKYRVPARPDVDGLPHWWAPLQDAQRAVSIVKDGAKRGLWGGVVHPDQVGFSGFSAGGHLTAHVSTAWRSGRAYVPVDAADKQTSRPDFSILMYPWMLLPENQIPAFGQPYRLANEFTDGKGGSSPDKNHPPTMFVHNEDDLTAPVMGSSVYHAKLSSVGAPGATVLFTPTGGHGFGLCQNGFPVFEQVCDWPKTAQRFLQSHGFAPGLPQTVDQIPLLRDMLTQNCESSTVHT